MMKEAEITGNTTRRRVRKFPKQPVPSEFKRVPKNLPIDFYDPSWFNQLPPGQKRLIVNAQQVAFLPNAALSLNPVRHPDEKLGDNQFTGKYLDIFLEAYQLSDEEEGAFDEENDSGSDTSIDLEAASEGTDEEEEESDTYEEGEYGDLYDDKRDKPEAGEEKESDDANMEGSASSGKAKAAAQEDSDDEEDSDFCPED